MQLHVRQKATRIYLHVGSLLESNVFRITHATRATVLAAQNEQLGRAIQNLYAYVQSGNCLPVLSIIVFANTLLNQARYIEGKSPQETLQSSNSLDEVSAWAQTEPWLGPSPRASIPEMMNSTLQSQAQYEEESQADVEDIWSMVDVNASEAATLYAFLQSLRDSS
jgi:hypothetical protein